MSNIDDRLLNIHQRIADAVHSRTGIGCYALGASAHVAICIAVLLMALTLSTHFILHLPPGAELTINLFGAWLPFMYGILFWRENVARLLRAQRHVDESWKSGSLPVRLPPPHSMRWLKVPFFRVAFAIMGWVCMPLSIPDALLRFSQNKPYAFFHLGLSMATMFLLTFGFPGMAYYERCRPRPPSAGSRKTSVHNAVAQGAT